MSYWSLIPSGTIYGLVSWGFFKLLYDSFLAFYYSFLVLYVLAFRAALSSLSNVLVNMFSQQASLPISTCFPEALAASKLQIIILYLRFNMNYRLQLWPKNETVICLQEDWLNWAAPRPQCRLWHEKEVYTCKYAANLMQLRFQS